MLQPATLAAALTAPKCHASGIKGYCQHVSLTRQCFGWLLEKNTPLTC